MFSKFFIDRPIFATVLALLMIFAGIMTVRTLPVAQYPDITPPTVMVNASYPGADAETVARTVGVPIEEQVNGVEGMLYMSSNSGSDGSYSLTITFENGTDIDEAAVEVQNRIALANASLPSAVTRQGVSVNKQSSNNVLFVALLADDDKRYDALYLTNYAQLNMTDPLTRVEGVGGVQAFGGGEYSMRVWLDPEAMRMRNLTPADVEQAIRSQNIEVSAGSVGDTPSHTGSEFQYTLTASGRLTTPQQFSDIILRTDGQGILRLGDVAKVELGSDSYAAVAKVNGRPAALIGISQLPGANAMEVAKGSIAELDRLSKYFPDGIHYEIVLNSTDYVRESIDDVVVTFVETTLIVMIVILLFLQNWRAVIIPMLTIPVSLIATFAVMKLMGFSLNTLTLFGLVLAIAIVVDDAIVVVEDCSRLLDQGKLTPRKAAEKAMMELQGPVVGEVLVLLSVFIPTAFVSGITGQLYKQFALTIAVSTAFSGINALTLTPALCALFLKPTNEQNSRFFIYRWFNKGFGATTDAYMKIVGSFLRRPAVAIGAYLIICLVAFYGFIKMPTTYIPQEDMGQFIGSVQLPTSASLSRTDSIMRESTDRLLKVPGVANAISIAGYSFTGGGAGSNVGSLVVTLEPWKDRKPKSMHVDEIIAKFEAACADIQEAIIFAVNPPAIPGLGMTSGLQMQLLDINNLGSAQLAEAIREIQDAAAKDDRIASVTTMYEGGVPQYRLEIDRDKVKMYGINLSDVYSALGSYMSNTYVNDFNEFGRVYQVLLSADASARGSVQDVLKLSVRNANGEMVPFGAFATAVEDMGDAQIDRYNMYRTASVTATPAHGVSSSEGIKAMEEIVRNALGKEYSYAWTGEAYQETKGGVTVSIVMLFAVIVTILVLAAQYESLTDPVAVVISMPTAILGTVIGCIFMGQAISIYTQIGLILLLGLSAKNAILIVEYARDYRKGGMDIRQAAENAGRVRFRPIMMTALAFVFGVMPMLFATGAGAASRVSLGTAVVFGMFINAVVGTLFVPNFWELLERFREKHLDKFFGGGIAPAPTAPDAGKDAQQGEESV